MKLNTFIFGALTVYAFYRIVVPRVVLSGAARFAILGNKQRIAP